MTAHAAPIMVPAPYRPVQIATVHAAAVFLAENPDLPMPARVEMSANVATLELLHILAEAHRAEIVEKGQWVWFTVPVAVESLHGMEIDYRVYYRHPDITPMDSPPRGLGIVSDPWADVMATPRCAHRLYNQDGPARCVKNVGHTDPHFFDNDETDPCANGRCPDRAAHAEGAHDL